MSDANAAASGTATSTNTIAPDAAAQAAAAATAAQPAAQAPAVTPAAAPAAAQEPAWLKERIEQAKRSALRDLGVSDPEAAKRVLAEAKASEDAKKTAEQRAAEARAEADAAKRETERLRAVTVEYAERMMVGLTDAQRKAVTDIAGDDAAARIKAIGALQSTWSAPAQAATTQPAKAAPASTTPAAAQPNDGTGGPVNHRAVYEATQADNPFKAAIYGQKNPGVYTPAS